MNEEGAAVIPMEYILSPRDAALKNIGRIIVNFQRLEQQVKALATIKPFSGTLTKVQRDRERHIEKTLGSTLGHAINSWVENLDGTRTAPPITTDLFDIAITSRINFGFEPEMVARHAKQLRDLLTYRNEFIHGSRLKINWESDSDCEALSVEINEWIEKIREQMDFLFPIIKSLASIRPEDYEIVEGED